MKHLDYTTATPLHHKALWVFFSFLSSFIYSYRSVSVIARSGLLLESERSRYRTLSRSGEPSTQSDPGGVNATQITYRMLHPASRASDTGTIIIDHETQVGGFKKRFLNVHFPTFLILKTSEWRHNYNKPSVRG